MEAAPFFSAIDWTRPWLMPLLPAAQPILRAPDWRQALNDAAASLRNHRDLPIRFVPQAELPAGTSYEVFISATGRVPTRDNLHDFFNALVWLTFPKIKAQLNALQAAEIAKATMAAANASIPLNRGKVRDAATIFDENAALLITTDAGLVSMLRNREWHQAFVVGRGAFLRQCEVHLFGHAMMEKLVVPYKAITAHAWVVEATSSFFTKTLIEKQAWVDTQVSRHLTAGLSTSSFMPLPVLGVPGWWEKNEDEIFYDDPNVFRTRKILKT